MVNFEVQKIEEFETKQNVNKLVRNGKCPFDSFVNEVKKDKNMSGELGDLFAIIRIVANDELSKPPKKKYRKLKLSGKLAYSAFEAKSKHLRLYLIQEKGTGIIFMLGGMKKTQESNDLDNLEQLIKDYTQFKIKKK